MAKNIIASLLLLASFAAGPLYGEKAETLRTVRVSVFPLEPLNFIDENGQAMGLYPDLVRRIGRNYNWEIIFVPCSWSECLDSLQNEQIDLMSIIAFTPERAKTIDYSKEPVVDIWGQIFIRPGSKISNILDLQGKRVAVMKRDINGSNFIQTAKKFGVSPRIVELATHDEVFRLVATGKAAAGVAPQHFGFRHAEKYGLVGSSIQFKPFSIYFAAKMGKNHDLLRHIDSQISRWKQKRDSYYYERLNYWLGAREYEKEIIPRWLLISVALILIITAALVLMNRVLNYRVKERTKELDQREKQYRDLVENSNSIILRLDSEGRIIFINQYGSNFFGFSQEEILGKHIFDVVDPVTDNKEEDFNILVSQMLKVPGRSRVRESENTNRNGRRTFLQWSDKIIFDDHKKVKEILSVGTDITIRKKLESELFQSQKMEAIGTLAGGIAHDFNNILSVILGYSELAQHHIENHEKARIELEKVIEAALRARDLVGQILSFGRKSEVEKQLLQPSILVKEVVRMIRSTIPATVEIIINITTDKKIYADATQIHQVIMNLCTNGYQSMNGAGGILGVALDEIEVTGELSELLKLKTGGGSFIRLEISDNGKGMDRQTVDKIFEPYFTTKGVGKGTGLGLAVVHGIVREHEGHVKVYSEPGEGTTVSVYFPISGKGSVPDPEMKEAPAESGGTESILVVDDEKDIARYVSEALAERGYRVQRYSSSKRALKAFLEDPDVFDLAVLDMTMPELTGADMVREMFQVKPGFPVILCTGFSELISKEKAMELGVKAYLQKPVLVPDMLRTVRQVLDEK